MNIPLYEYWVRRSLINANRGDRRDARNLTASQIRAKLLEQMCSVAKGGLDIDAELKLRYIPVNEKWNRFDPGIFEMSAFREIIDRNLSGILKDKTLKDNNYIRTLAIAFMKEYYDIFDPCKVAC